MTVSGIEFKSPDFDSGFVLLLFALCCVNHDICYHETEIIFVSIV